MWNSLTMVKKKKKLKKTIVSREPVIITIMACFKSSPMINIISIPICNCKWWVVEIARIILMDGVVVANQSFIGWVWIRAWIRVEWIKIAVWISIWRNTAWLMRIWVGREGEEFMSKVRGWRKWIASGAEVVLSVERPHLAQRKPWVGPWAGCKYQTSNESVDDRVST